MEEKQLIENRQLRDKMSGRFEVLESVKKLLMIPGTDVMSAQQVADYYEVGKEAIEAIYTRHIDELNSDGVYVRKYNDYSNLHYESLKTAKGKAILIFENGYVLEYPTRGLKVFPRRAILRTGMLLRDSEVAKEVRSQLLNIEEKTSTETKTEDIDTEQSLMLAIGMAVASGDATAVAIASAKMTEFKNRHIAKLEQDNKALASGILEWGDKKNLNAGIRKLAAVTGIPFGKMWSELYKELQYKYGICLKTRNNGKKPYIDNVKETEWNDVIKTFCAMCEAYDQSPTEMFQKTVSIPVV